MNNKLIYNFLKLEKMQRIRNFKNGLKTEIVPQECTENDL